MPPTAIYIRRCDFQHGTLCQWVALPMLPTTTKSCACWMNGLSLHVTYLIMQLLHAKGKPTIFTSKADQHWKLVRKGVAPAFNPKNIR